MSQLASEGLDLLQPLTVVEVRTKDGLAPNPNIKTALESLQRQLRSGTTRLLKLRVYECKALLTLFDLVTWGMDDTKDMGLDVYPFGEPLHMDSYYDDHESYHVIALEQDSRREEIVSLVQVEWVGSKFGHNTEEQRRRRKKMRIRKELHKIVQEMRKYQIK